MRSCIHSHLPSVGNGSGVIAQVIGANQDTEQHRAATYKQDPQNHIENREKMAIYCHAGRGELALHPAAVGLGCERFTLR